MRIQEAYEEVDRILRALEKRDAVAAREAMRRHIQATIDFRKQREGFARPKSATGADDRPRRRLAGARSRSSR
jgi:DNA-binding GntR family transcriptional regulator